MVLGSAASSVSFFGRFSIGRLTTYDAALLFAMCVLLPAENLAQKSQITNLVPISNGLNVCW